MWRSFLEVLPAVHGARAEGLGLRCGLAEELAWWQGYLGWATDGSSPPALAGALAWCADHLPAAEPPDGLLWGDVRLGNVVFDPGRRAPRAVLDWDMAGVGPAEMDLAWFLALEAVQQDLTGMTVPGFGTREEAIAIVEAGLGRRLDDLGWYEVFALVRASAVSTAHRPAVRACRPAVDVHAGPRPDPGRRRRQDRPHRPGRVTAPGGVARNAAPAIAGQRRRWTASSSSPQLMAAPSSCVLASDAADTPITGRALRATPLGEHARPSRLGERPGQGGGVVAGQPPVPASTGRAATTPGPRSPSARPAAACGRPCRWR